MADKYQVAETIFTVIKRLIKWAVIGVVVYWLGIFLLMYVFVNISSSKDSVSIKVVNEMNGVKLNESLGDVLFKKKEYKKSSEAQSKSLANERYVIYDDGKYEVVFDNDKSVELNDTCGKIYVGEKGVNGIVCDDSSERILNQYGEQINIYCMKDNTRVYLTPNYNVAYYLKSNEVKRISVSKYITKQDAWLDCKDFKFKPNH